jgi:hypothetical protein
MALYPIYNDLSPDADVSKCSAATNLNTYIDYYKTMLQQYGILRVNYHNSVHTALKTLEQKGICHTTLMLKPIMEFLW